MRRFEKILIPVDLGHDSLWQEALPMVVSLPALMTALLSAFKRFVPIWPN